MAQILLTFDLDRETDAAVREICKRLGIQKKNVATKDYAQKLGCLAGVTGFAREKTIYTGSAFSEGMIVFSGVSSGLLDLFLAEYGKTSLPAIGIKAIITAHNAFWTAEMLYRELCREHASHT